MAALDSAPATRAIAALAVETARASTAGVGRRADVDDHDRLKVPDVLDGPCTVRAATEGNGHIFIDAVRNGPVGGGVALLAPRRLRVLDTLAPPEGGGLSLGRTSSLFELGLESNNLTLECRDVAPTTGTLGRRHCLLAGLLLGTQLLLQRPDLTPEQVTLLGRLVRFLVNDTLGLAQAIALGFGLLAGEPLGTQPSA